MSVESQHVLHTEYMGPVCGLWNLSEHAVTSTDGFLWDSLPEYF